MRRGPTLLVLATVAAACSSGSEPTTTTTATTVAPTTTTTVSETTTTVPPECSRPPYEVGVLPTGVGSGVVDPADLPSDPYVEIPGSSSTIWLAEDGALAVVLVRGSLPLEDWPGESGEVVIDGARARVGPFDDGSWVAGWFEQPGERCDQFTMVFYPPVDSTEVQATLESMNRIAG